MILRLKDVSLCSVTQRDNVVKISAFMHGLK